MIWIISIIAFIVVQLLIIRQCYKKGYEDCWFDVRKNLTIFGNLDKDMDSHGNLCYLVPVDYLSFKKKEQ